LHSIADIKNQKNPHEKNSRQTEVKSGSLQCRILLAHLCEKLHEFEEALVGVGP
jgi:hypothetical protein